MDNSNDSELYETENLSGLLNFAAGLLEARGKTRLRVDSEKLGCFREAELIGIPGLSITSDAEELQDEEWLKLQRVKATKPPLPSPESELFPWIDKETISSPSELPQFLPMLVNEVPLGKANSLIAEGLLAPESVEFQQVEMDEELDATDENSPNESYDQNENTCVAEEHGLFEQDQKTLVKIFLKLDKNPRLLRELELWRDTEWTEWSKREKPIRQSVSLYKKLFKLHTILHSGDSSANELVWGVGMAEYGKDRSADRIDIPLIEFLVDIDLSKDGIITLTPREVPPYLNLRPLLEAGLDGAEYAQQGLQESFNKLKESDDVQLSPFSADDLDLFFTEIAGQISSDAEYIDRETLTRGTGAEASTPRNPDSLRINASWVIYGRPRSTNFRVDDLRILNRKLVELNDEQLPDPLCGFVKPLPEEDDSTGIEKVPDPIYLADWGDFVQQKHQFNQSNYFFPLASNEDQNQIIEQLEKYPVVTVTGPPGTGKTHSIANILAHYMATGKRVLVTARTAEAIKAVRGKLPDELASLVIASVASDKEGARQLESAIQRLSDEVVHLNQRQLQDEIERSQQAIATAEKGIIECEVALARISQKNLTPIVWMGRKVTVLELADELNKLNERYSWFEDRPDKQIDQTLDNAVIRIITVLQSYPEYIGYTNVRIPDPDDLPSTGELIEYHQHYLEADTVPDEDYSNEPNMAIDSIDAMAHAEALERWMEKADKNFSTARPWHRKLISGMLANELKLSYPGAVSTNQSTAVDVGQVIANMFALTAGITPPSVEINHQAVERAELLKSIQERAHGKKTILSSFFNRKIEKILDDTHVDGRRAGKQSDWQAVLDWLKIEIEIPKLRSMWEPLATSGRLPTMPTACHDIAKLVVVFERQRTDAVKLISKMKRRLEVFETLFPYGIDAKEHFVRLEFDRLGRALKANLKSTPAASDIELKLRHWADKGEQQVFQTCRKLLESLHSTETDSNDIIQVRAQLTDALQKVIKCKPQLASLQDDLQTLKNYGAPMFAENLMSAYGPPDHALTNTNDTTIEGISESLRNVDWDKNWQEAWKWASARRELDDVLSLGNGDEWRDRKLKLHSEKQYRLRKLIEAKTKAGLKIRITPRIQSEFMRFTQAIEKLGGGSGLSAHRHRKTIKDAARKSASAVPVWVMPESKVSEQLPAELGSFDLVILDEASQSDITTIGILARGKRLLIVGDEKQVSPSAVGVTIERVDQLRAEYIQNLPARDSYDEKTSIFDIAMQRYPQSHLMLKEHFRCVHPIIEFSTQFYNGRLIPLRVAKTSERFDPPLVDVHIRGATRNGKINEAEANYIVEEIATITANKNHRERDIAVISLIGGEQAEHIERQLMDDPRIGPEIIERHHIVCGDSRTMQGQERSIVFLSMVADATRARVQQSREDKQRYNVAMSRARDREYVVRSVAARDLKSNDLKLAVINHLKNPLKEGSSVVIRDVLERCDSGFERDVCKRLLEAGYRVRSQVSAGSFRIDLVVEGENDLRLAVELDGDYWHGPDRWAQDMARQASLERAGWIFWRVFGSQWYSDQKYYWESLTGTLDSIGIEPIGGEAVEGDFTEHRVIDISEIDNLGGHSDTKDGDLSHNIDGESVEITVFTDETEDVEPARENAELPMTNPSNESTDQIGDHSPVSAERNIEEVAIAAEHSTAIPTQTQTKYVSDQFYDSNYRAALAEHCIEIIEKTGPINFDDLATRIARLHGFSRTGPQIRNTIREAIAGKRIATQYDDNPDVIWPAGMEATEQIPFQGLTVAGVKRDWKQLPWPEKVGMASIAIKDNPEDPVSAIMAMLEISRAGAVLRSDFSRAVQSAME